MVTTARTEDLCAATEECRTEDVVARIETEIWIAVVRIETEIWIVAVRIETEVRMAAAWIETEA